MFRQAVFVLLVCIIFEGSRSTDDSSSIQNTLKKLNDTLHKLPVEFDTVIDDVEEELKEVWVETKVDGYTFYHFRGCSGRDEIFSGKLNCSNINRCKAKCDNNDNCVSFEYWGESNPHWKLGEGVCHVSSSCIFERSARKEKEGNGPNCNLYIKGENFYGEFWRQQQFKLIRKQKTH